MLKLLQSNFYRLFLLATLLLGVNASWGQTVYWNFTSSSPSTNATNITTSALTQGNNNGTTTMIGSTSASSTGDYTGASAGNNAGAAAYTGTLNTSNSTYFQFTLTPATGYSLTVTQVEFGTRSTSTGPQAYTIKNAAALSTDLATGTISNNSTWVYKTSAVNLTSTGAVTIRIYGHSGTGSAATNTANWRIDDLKISVTATSTNAAPTASSVAISGANYNVGTTLTGSYTYADAESNPEGTSTYKWYTATDNTGTGAAAISGATATTYPLTTAEAGKYIRFSVVPVATAGTTTGSETFSSWYGPVVNTSPSLSPSPTSLSGFTYINNNGPSSSQSFNLSGSLLTGAPGSITVTAPTDYVVSSDNTTFGPTATVAYTSATLSSAPVYVKLKAGLAPGTYNSETVSISGGGATASVTVSGSVTNQAPTASNVIVSGANYIVGTQLTGSFTYADYESNPQGTSTYKWYTATDNTGTGAAQISGATATTITLASAQLAKYIRYSVTPVASAGTTTGVETFSGWYGPVVAPSLAISGSTTAHGTVCVNTSGTSVTYTITNNGTAAASGIAVATSNSMFAVSGLSSTTIPAGGTATYVVTFTPTASGSQTATITVSSTTGGSNSPTSSLTGTGTAVTTATVGNSGGASTTGSTTATLNGTASVNNCSGAITAYGIYYSTTYGFANGAGTQVAGSNLSAGAFIANLTGLTPNTTYYYKAYATNASGTSYSGQNAFTTTAYVVNAPVATTANPISLTSFNANWNNESTANSYRLDVATTNAFAATLLSEDFSNFTNANGASSGVNYGGSGTPTSPLFQTSGWGGTQIWYDSDGAPRLGTGSNPGSLITPTLNLSGNSGTATLTFDVKRYNNDAAATIQVYHSPNGTDASFAQVGSNTVITAATPDFLTLTYTITGGTANSKIKILGLNGNQRFYIDNILVSYSTILPSYNNITVAELTKLVSGLTENTTYYYRVRGVNTTYSVTSANSNVIPVTTGRPLTWTGTTWSYGATTGVTPTVADSGTVAGTYNTATNGNLTIGTLTVNNGQAVTVTTDKTITVANAITNNGNFTVQNNGALVQNNAATNSGNIVVIKNSNALYRLDYTLWSSPVTGAQTLHDFSAGTAATRFYDYDSTTDYYMPLDATATTFSLAKGYLIRMPNVLTGNVTGTTNGGVTTPAEYIAGEGDYYFAGSFNGVPNNGTITKTLSTANNRYTAVGNPYPSPISVVEFFTQNSSVLQAGTGIYLWRKRNNAATTSYATITATSYTFNSQNGSTATGGGVNSGFFNLAPSNWRIAPGQGFMVQASSSATNPVLTFTNSMRKEAVTGGVSFFKQQQNMSDLSRYWLDISNTNGSASQLSVAYLDGATTGIDYSYDALVLNNENYMTFYTLTGESKLNVQTRPSFENTDVVPAGFNAIEAGTYTITLSNKDGVFEEGQKIYLKDNQEGIIHNLENPYTFATSEGIYNNRFEIIYTTNALGTDNPVAGNNVMVFKNNNTVTVNAGSTLINSVEIFDIRGRKLYSESNINATNFSTDKLAVENQVIIVKVNTTTGTVSKKIIF